MPLDIWRKKKRHWLSFQAMFSYTNESTSEKDYKVLLDDIYRTILKYDPKELVLLSLPNMVESKELYDYLNDGHKKM